MNYNYIYNSLLNYMDLFKQYLASNGLSYSSPDNSQYDQLNVIELFKKLDNIKKGLYSSNSTLQLNEAISEFISIKYNPMFISIIDSVYNSECTRSLKKVSTR
ncbi:MAG: hypothetical protein HFE04_00695 [Bacilli bacterium]|nr:hypothetical protein [Bacilli bacterium]